MTEEERRAIQIETLEMAEGLLRHAREALVPPPEPVPEPEPTNEPWPLGVLNPNFADGTDWPHPNYKMPLKEEMWAHWANIGSKSARVSFRWEAIQPVLDGPLDAAKLADMLKVPEMAARYGMVVLWNMHNYARRNETGSNSIGEPGGPTADQLAQFWGEFAKQMMHHPNVCYGLMNEPMGDTVNWPGTVQKCVDAIRGAGDMRSRIMASGIAAGHAWEWPERNGNLALIKDPASALWFEAHQYADQNSSGTYTQSFETAYNPTWVRSLPDPMDFHVKLTDDFVDEWLKPRGLKGIIGETGIPSAARWNGTAWIKDASYRPEWVEVLRRMLLYCKANEVPVFLWMDGIHAEANKLYIGHKAPDNPIRDMIKSVLAA